MEKRTQRSAWKRRKRPASLAHLFVIIAGAMILLGGLAAFSGAKYVQSKEGKGYAIAQEFYFTSDLLDSTTHVYASGTKTITITLGNNADQLRYAEMDINYTVTVKDSADNEVTIDNDSGTLTANELSQTTITLSGLTPGTTYTVTATGENGYTKTLTGKFKVLSEEETVYQSVETTDDYVLLTVWSKKYQGEVTITFSGLVPDNTDPIMTDVKIDAGSFTDKESFQSGGYSSHTYRFFYDNMTKVFSVNATYGEANTKAQSGTPN